MKNKLLNTFFVGLFSTTLAAGLNADVLKIKENSPELYVVKKGDTLWDISSKYLNTPWRWPEIWGLNDDIENPHLIYPGDKIRLIIDEDGNKIITINNQPKPLKKITLSPEKKPFKQNIHINSINFNKINTLVNGLVLNESDISNYGKVLGNNDTESFYSKSDTVFVKTKNVLESGDSVNFYSEPKRLKDNSVLLTYSGKGRVLQPHKENMYSVYVETSVDMISPNNLIVDEDKNYNYSFNFSDSSDVTFNETGIFYSFEQKTFLGKGNIFLINKGENDNLKIGQVFALEKRGKKIEGNKLPNENIGYAVVFNTNKNYSFLQIVLSKKPVDVETTIVKKIEEN